jgi:N-acyl-D-aspartate/D-glutamate deacylase
VAKYDILIKGGMIIDGRRSPRFRADVGIVGGTIARIGNLRGAVADRVIDAEGCIVAPGIIDMHTHYDSQIFWDPYVSPSGWHGVTSVIMGNCGFGFAPVAPEHREKAMLTMVRAEEVPMVCMKQGMPWDWVTYPEFLDSLRRTPKSVNLLPLVPLNPLMAWVMGLERAKSGVLPTDAEHAEMARLLNEAMDAGGGGISAQRHGPHSPQSDYDGSPMITDVMHDETMLHLAKVLGDRDEGIIQYNYNDHAAMFGGDVAKRDMIRRHVQEVARVSGRPVLVGGLGDGDRAFVRESMDKGLRIYPGYMTVGFNRNASSAPRTTCIADQAGALDKAGPGWAHATSGSVEEVKAKLADPQVRDAMRADLPHVTTVLGEIGTWLLVRAATPELARYEQAALRDVATDMGYGDCVDAFCDISIADDLKTKWQLKALFTVGKGEPSMPHNPDLELLFPLGPETFKKIADDEWGVPGGSDGGAHTKSMTAAHFGIHFLINYVRDQGWLSLEEGHWRVSGLPAFQAGLGDRGKIMEGAPADIIVYDYEKLGLTERVEARDYPGGEWRLVDRPVGLHYVLVNGSVTMEHDTQTGVASGKLLKDPVKVREMA